MPDFGATSGKPAVARDGSQPAGRRLGEGKAL